MNYALLKQNESVYVDFRLEPVEDREASIKAGHPVFHDVEMATITPAGGSLTVEKVIDENLLNLWRYGDPRRDPPTPARPFLLMQYENWKKGVSPIVDGLDIKNWPGATPAQVKTCLEANVRTVEDLAAAGEPTLARLGMGARALKDKAVAYLQSAKQDGVVAEEVVALKAQIGNMQTTIDALQETIHRLQAQQDEPAAKGRKGKKDAEA